MTYMEIATYLGMASVVFTQTAETDTEDIDLLNKMRIATLEAQLVMYELARKEMRGEATK